MGHAVIDLLLYIYVIAIECLFLVHICDRQTGTIDCATGSIKVHKAFYGKRGKNACTRENKWLVSCVQDIVEHARSQCEGKQSCSLSSSTDALNIDDPCESIKDKYIEITYNCSGNGKFYIKLKVYCENMTNNKIE